MPVAPDGKGVRIAFLTPVTRGHAQTAPVIAFSGRPDFSRPSSALTRTRLPPGRCQGARVRATLGAMSQLERQAAALWREDVEKVYADGTHALRGLAIHIPAGCFFGLLGPNGSGKSTLIGMVSGLVRAPAGSLFVFGCDAVAQAPSARLLVGVAPQDGRIQPVVATLDREELRWAGRDGRRIGLEAERRATELLEVFDLTAKANTKPNRLSGGMRWRLLIARALMHRPRLLILDEPTAGVDLELRRELWSYLRALHQHEDTTVLLTTHYLEEAEALCERVAFIRAGQLVAQGTVSELVQRYGGSDLEDAYIEAMR
jgi:ABC-2 type transport system ATP-binding protein